MSDEVYWHGKYVQAADSVEALEAENERLRGVIIGKEAELDKMDTVQQYLANHFPAQLDEAERHAALKQD